MIITNASLNKIFRVLILFIFTFFLLENTYSINQQNTKQIGQYQNLREVRLSLNIVKSTNKSDKVIEKNILTQEMLNQNNTRYVILYDYDLNDAKITIPKDCILDFQGGSLNNGKIIFNNTLLLNPRINILNTTFTGNIQNESIEVGWFGIYPNGNDITEKLNKLLECCLSYTDESNNTNNTKFYQHNTKIKFSSGVYKISNTIYIPNNNAVDQVQNRCLSIHGNGVDKTVFLCKNDIVAFKIPETFTSMFSFKDFSMYAENVKDKLPIEGSIGIEASSSCYAGVIIENLFVRGFDIGIDAYLCASAIRQVTARGCNKGIHFKGTSTTIQNCYTIVCNIGYDIEGFTYSTLLNCAGDGNETTYYLHENIVNGVVKDCGSEQSFNGIIIEGTPSQTYKRVVIDNFTHDGLTNIITLKNTYLWGIDIYNCSIDLSKEFITYIGTVNKEYIHFYGCHTFFSNLGSIKTHIPTNNRGHKEFYILPYNGAYFEGEMLFLNTFNSAESEIILYVYPGNSNGEYISVEIDIVELTAVNTVLKYDKLLFGATHVGQGFTISSPSSVNRNYDITYSSETLKEGKYAKLTIKRNKFQTSVKAKINIKGISNRLENLKRTHIALHSELNN